VRGKLLNSNVRYDTCGSVRNENFLGRQRLPVASRMPQAKPFRAFSFAGFRVRQVLRAIRSVFSAANKRSSAALSKTLPERRIEKAPMAFRPGCQCKGRHRPICSAVFTTRSIAKMQRRAG
jgi:hypothetical protein